ncbi:hypothetical protein MJO28_013676 [Puccinia striiformis f. sp. tritici]|uniref:Uncharacterized protein n=3 Tax=Puccinia striiformis TaxID=27350 RepID=A0ACC0DV03_9BASI|nr:hypothetical protein MJO28_013676 [Puccinia striiformis f. sp. tritici]
MNSTTATLFEIITMLFIANIVGDVTASTCGVNFGTPRCSKTLDTNGHPIRMLINPCASYCLSSHRLTSSCYLNCTYIEQDGPLHTYPKMNKKKHFDCPTNYYPECCGVDNEAQKTYCVPADKDH